MSIETAIENHQKKVIEMIIECCQRNSPESLIMSLIGILNQCDEIIVCNERLESEVRKAVEQENAEERMLRSAEK